MTLLVLNALLVFPLFLDRPRVSLAVESHDGIFFISGFSFFCSFVLFPETFRRCYLYSVSAPRNKSRPSRRSITQNLPKADGVARGGRGWG